MIIGIKTSEERMTEGTSALLQAASNSSKNVNEINDLVILMQELVTSRTQGIWKSLVNSILLIWPLQPLQHNWIFINIPAVLEIAGHLLIMFG